MKQLNQNELFEHLSGFLKSKGIEFKEGSYAQGIQKSCGLLTDAINLGQTGLEKAKVKIDKKLEQVRQVVHEKTAPKPPVTKTAPASSASGNSTGQAKAAGAKSGGKKSKTKKAKSRK